MMPWKWLLKRSGITKQISDLEKKLVCAQDDVRVRDGRLANFQKLFDDAMEARESWRDTAIRCTKDAEECRRKLRTIREAIPRLIRYDASVGMIRPHDMISDPLGEYVKYKALESLFLEN